MLSRARTLAEASYGNAALGTGEPAREHAAAIAGILESMRIDEATQSAGWLFAAPRHIKDYREVLVRECGDDVAGLVENVDRLHGLRLVTRSVSSLAEGEERRSQVEVLRKMLLAMVGDIRAVLVRLASRTQTMRYLVHTPDESRRLFAQEAMEIYAPLANRLGVWQVKWELEDLAFRFLEPQTYKQIAGLLDERREQREAFITEITTLLKSELAAAGIECDIAGRPKHIYSIYKKMQAKGREFDELYDLRAVRVLVNDVRECYTALGVVHNLWQPIPKEFDDYISRPKPNSYRSLHTAVIAPDGRSLEVQIRTHEMHRQAELGVAAHWRYKEGARSGGSYEERIAWLRQVLAWRDELVDGAQWREQVKQAAIDDTVYVLTPQGKVIDLPRGSTPIDFAYHVHTDLGHRCRGAKVDGSIVPLDYKLENGQRVDIVTAKTGGPSRDWLNPELGYLASGRARNKVRQWFNALELEETTAAGRAIVERELRREGKSKANLDELAGKLGFEKADDLFLAAGRDEVGVGQLHGALREAPPPGAHPAAPAAPPVARPAKTGRGDERGVLVGGVDGLLIQFAKCCRPVPPDAIRGFVTRGRGVSIHRRDCRSLAALVLRQSERAIDASWGRSSPNTVYAADVHVEAQDRQGLLRDISEVFARDHINVIAVNTITRDGVASMDFTVEVSGAVHLARSLDSVAKVRGVYAAGRRN
jgi:GTP pyrophosphokinase